MSTDKSTPRPWEVRSEKSSSTESGKVLCIREPRAGGNYVAELLPCHQGDGQLVIDAELITRAVNQYDHVQGLVEAAREFTEYYAGNKQSQLGNGQAFKSCDRLRSALAHFEVKP